MDIADLNEPITATKADRNQSQFNTAMLKQARFHDAGMQRAAYRKAA